MKGTNCEALNYTILKEQHRLRKLLLIKHQEKNTDYEAPN
jgi:hypothetical protein